MPVPVPVPVPVSVSVPDGRQAWRGGMGSAFSRRHHSDEHGHDALQQAARDGRVSADKGYDTKPFVASARQMGATPPVAQFQHARRSSAIDGRTTRHRGYSMTQRSRLLIEKIFGWMKSIGGFRRSRFRGSQRTALAGRLVAATYNLLPISRLASA